VPIGQGSHSVPTPVVPAGQTHSEVAGSRKKESTQAHEVEPSSERSLAGHTEQLSLSASLLNLPASHGSHVGDAVPLIEPGWQDKQTVLFSDAFLPGLQAVQKPDPAQSKQC